jgi:glycine cleavage system H protein
MLKFTAEHEWLKIDGDIATVGITDFAQHALGDVVYVELPPVGKDVKQRDETAVVESVKAASDVYAPLSGKIIAVNDALATTPALVNTAPQSEGWFFKLHLSTPAELEGLLDQAGYNAHIKALG